MCIYTLMTWLYNHGENMGENVGRRGEEWGRNK